MNTKAIVAVASAVSFAAGALSTYFAVKKKLEVSIGDKAAEQMNKEIEAARVHYARLYKRDEYSSPSEVLDRRTPQAPLFEDGKPETAEQREANANHGAAEFIKIVEAKGYAPAEYLRNAKTPYVVTHDEFYTNEAEYEQVTLTYFAGDDTLTDDAEEPVENEVYFIGRNNLNFGTGSGDPNVVYICNNHLRTYYEVCRSEDRYAARAGLEA